MQAELQAQHERLEALFASARDVLQAGDDLDAARHAIQRLRRALDTHFAQEDALYYPAIWALRPEHKPGLLAAVEAHRDLRERVARIDPQLAAGDLLAARGQLDELAAQFETHERAEEQLLAGLERELAASG